MKPAPFTYHAAHSVEQVVALLASHAPEGRILAGGQSLVPMMAFRLAQPAHLIDINRIPGLDRLAVAADHLRIGATVRHAAFQAPAPAPGSFGALLAAVAAHIGHGPIRARGTFCGSLAHADPASEWCLVLATLGGRLVAHGPRGLRAIGASDWFRGIMATALAPDEMLVEARLAIPPPGTRFGFREQSRRAADFAMAMALVAYRVAESRIIEPRVGVGGAEPMPRRIMAAEAVLEGGTPEPGLFALAAEAAGAAVDPMQDPQIPVTLRRDLVRASVRRALEATLA
jgi:carbon-monoxide dehydrogenase medium subunit